MSQADENFETHRLNEASRAVRERYERDCEQERVNFIIHGDNARYSQTLHRLEIDLRDELDYIQHQRDRMRIEGRYARPEIRRDGSVARRPGYRPMNPFFDEESESELRTTQVVRRESTLDQLDRLRGMIAIEPGQMIAVDDPHEVIARHAEADRQREVSQAFERAMLHGRGVWKVVVDEDAEYKENDVKTTEKQASFAYCDEGHKKYIEPQERAFYLARCTEQGCNKFLKAGTALESTKQDGPAKSKKQAVNP